MITYHHRGLRIGLVYFGEEPDGTKIDVLYSTQRSTPLEGALCDEHRTLAVDLRRSPEELLAATEKHMAYKIRYAENKDGAVCERLDASDAAVRNEFWEFFTRFSVATELSAPDALSTTIFHAMGNAGVIELTAARDRDGTALAYHCYYRGRTAVLLKHACTLHRLAQDGANSAMIGRANRFLIWSDFLRFKAAGLTTYDFGGWYEGKSDEHRLRINRFKEEFGGQVMPIYNCRKGCTLRGKIAVQVRRALAWRTRNRTE